MNTAKIIAYTQPIISANGNLDTGAEPMSVDEFIAYVARVSNPSNQNNTLTAPKLLKYLAKHKHWSPFEQVDINMEINTTRDIGRQILRHRSFTFQEFSQRYADPTKDMGFVTREARLQDEKNRQNSIAICPAENELYNILVYEWEAQQAAILDRARSTYVWAIENGIAKEQARAVLPEGLTMSRMYMKGSLRSWITYIAIREKVETQKEHREIAKACKLEILQLFPSLSYLSNENDEWVV